MSHLKMLVVLHKILLSSDTLLAGAGNAVGARVSTALGLAVLMTLGGCATTQPPIRERPLSDARAPVILNQGDLLDLPAVHSTDFNVDSDPLFRLLVAEFAGQRGQLDLAVEYYVATAKQLQSLAVAQRATRIAVFARNNEAALEAAKIWVEKAPTDTEARQILAAMYIRAGDADAAFTHLEYVLNVESEPANRQLRMIANLLSREQDKVTALDIMERLISHDRGNSALLAYALLAIRSEQIDRASLAIDRLVDSGALETNIAMAYVALLQQHDESPSALEWLERSIEKDVDDHGLRLIYARLLADSNRYEEARVQFSILSTKTPDDSDVVYALGLLNLQANRIDAARANFQQLLDLKARSSDAYFYLAQIAESRDKPDDALELYRAVTRGTNYFQAQIRVGMILSSIDDVDNARAHLQSIATDNEEQRRHLVTAEGEILTDHDRLDEAMALYDRALDDIYDMDLLYTRAMLAEKMGRIDVLEADLRTIIEHEPDNVQALNALGYTLADRTERYEEAYALIERALALSPEDFYILDSMGWVLYRLGRLSDAVEFLTRARRLKDDPEVAAHLGEVLWVMGDKDAAKNIWDSALKDKPNDQRLLDAIERLAP
ncbi:MAG: tetratricopeptide repeat protein [Proteobacteria bacterium]|nr:MAG: tetratricopeptide repeat protein [Pseudomonadota bacterium]